MTFEERRYSSLQHRVDSVKSDSAGPPIASALPSPPRHARFIAMKAWLTLALMVGLPALASGQSIRCSEKIISNGSTRAEVSGLCGDPAQIEHKTIYNNVSASAGRSSLVAGTTVEIQVEMWVYNFGPDRLMQRVWFEDGVVVRIESLGRYGF